jgi:hypothetical protein
MMAPQHKSDFPVYRITDGSLSTASVPKAVTR